ncbi:MAG: CPBP family intramembrane metalloprotease [Tannerellaceae bacterium]|jgi:membrane protease YdiL (CAAX protease family)|nr:CPBP family intramembrane metalloprotease [Tannerellaceae bacterium]
MKFLEHALDKKNQVWKYLLVCLGALVVWPTIGQIPLLIVVLVKAFANGGLGALNPDNLADFSYLGLSKNLALGLVLFSMAVSLVLTVLLVKLLHKRTFSEVINGRKKIRVERCLTGAGVWFVIMLLAYAVDILINREDYIVQFNLSQFIPLLFIVLIFIPFQTTGEEFLFRGYLAQGLAAWTKRHWVAWLVPSLIFGLMHIANPEVKEFGFWASMPQYIYFGLFFGLISILDDGIELAMGLHAANNIFLALFATHKSSALQTDAVLEIVHLNPYKDTLLLVLMSAVAMAYFVWKYKWDFHILSRELRVEEPKEALPEEG